MDLTGQKFGRLTVIERAEDRIDSKGKHWAKWLCECNCENQTRKIIEQSHLTSGKIVSCGCYNKERIKETHKKNNKYILHKDFGVLWTSNTNEEVYFDIEDTEQILKYCWYKDCTGYPASTINNKTTRLHAHLGFKWCDHCNRNKLDNRKSNLRPCTQQENSMNRGLKRNNTSGITGVYWFSRDKKWKVQININKRVKSLGTFVNKKDAIKTRLIAELEYYGEFAPQKHLFKEYGIVFEGESNEKS